MDENDAKKHPDYKAFIKKISLYPTVNNKEYEMACYSRWLALAACQGKFMTDFDVLNSSLDPSWYDGIILNHEFKKLEILNFDVARVPCAVYIANERASSNLIRILQSGWKSKRSQILVNNKKHVSDMSMFWKLKIGDSIPICHLSKHGFPLRHFSSDSTGGISGKLASMREFVGRAE